MTAGPHNGGLSSQQGVQLASTFAALPDGRAGNYDVDVMDGLVQACVVVLDVAAAGLLLFDLRGCLQVVASSGGEEHLPELLQIQSAEGPCLDCVHSGASVTVHDLSAAAGRWPRFVEQATPMGYRSVHAFPLRLREEVIGGLTLFRKSGLPLDRPLEQMAQGLADVAATGVLRQRSTYRTLLLAEQLQTALDSRIVVEQAKGVLAEHGGLSNDEAYKVLRKYARDHNHKLNELAYTITTGGCSLDEILDWVRARSARHSHRR